MSFFKKSVKEIEYLKSAIQSPIYELVKVTPLQNMKRISKKFQNQVFAKREDLQLIHSFKLRGAYNMISKLSKKRDIRGIVTASAGNHAQGVALSASKIKKPALIVMPLKTAKIKIEAVKNLKAKVLLYGKNFDESKERAIEISNCKKYSYIPPFDHPDVISGQSTIAIELLNQNPLIDRIFVPVGGGGLISGIAILIKQLSPNIKIIAVETKDSASLKESLKIGHPVSLPFVGSFAEGVAVKRIGDENFEICKKYVDDVILVNNDNICLAIRDLFEEMRVIAEPSGALSLAGLKKYVKKYDIKKENLVHIVSGSNMNFRDFRYVADRSEVVKNKKIFIAVKIFEKVGSLLKFCKAISNYNIIELNYRYQNLISKETYIFVGIESTNEVKNCFKVVNDLEILGYKVIRFSNKKINKLKFFQIISGKKIDIRNEILLNVSIPEHSGSLLNFLKKLDNQWNIVLFHYQFNSYDYANIIISIEKKENKINLENCIKNMGYKYKFEVNYFVDDFFKRK